MGEGEGQAKYRVTIPDVDYFANLVKCRTACPVGTDSGGYVQAIAEGDYERAYAIARGPNPFASICGRVCGHPCEAACRRGTIDVPVSIRALKRFATEQYGVEALRDPAKVLSYSTARGNPGGFNTGEKVAIIGSGPAGLAAAHDLAMLGYRVTVFEAAPVAGGMMGFGIPDYRLSKELVKAEIAAIEAMGVEIRLNTPVDGKNLTLSGLKEMGYKATLIAIGLQNGRPLPIEGTDLKGVLSGIQFIKDVNMGKPVEIGQKVLIIGGGNVAYDASRSAVRLGPREVHMVCLESRAIMPADPVEIEEGEEEGIILHDGRGPKRVVGSGGMVAGLETVQCTSVFDENRRFNPQFAPNSESIIECDTVIVTVGQGGDLSFVRDEDGLEMVRPGVLKVNLDSYHTSVPGIFATGDIAYGPKLLITAVAAGQKAARSIDEYLSGKKVSFLKKGTMINLGEAKGYDGYRMFGDYDRLEREAPPIISPEARKRNVSLVEFNYDESDATAQGRRCLKCHINTIFDGELCILCGGCVDVCPTYCLKMVPLHEIEGDADLRKVVESRYQMSWDEIVSGDRTAVDSVGTAMIKDEDRCIRCGHCARRCPTGAVTMELFDYEEEVSVS